MKIDPNVPEDVLRNTPQTAAGQVVQAQAIAQTSGVRPHGRAAEQGERDSVSLSRTASELSSAIRAQPSTSGANPARLLQLREAVRTGSLALDIKSLAVAILSDEGRLP